MEIYRNGLTLLLAWILAATAAAADVIHYEGSSTIGRFIHEAREHYADADLRLYTKSESEGGQRCILANRCELGGVAGEVDPKVLAQGIKATLIGKDAIAVIVHPSNPITALSREQLRAVFAGEIDNWSQLGGPDLAIEVLLTKERSATRHVFADRVMDGHPYASGARVIAPDARLVPTVGVRAGAISQISLAFLHPDDGVRTLHIDDQAPDAANPAYPITRPLHLLSVKSPPPGVQRFIDWTLSPQGQDLVRHHFVGLQRNSH